MRILFAPNGTHGDLRPVLALALELQKQSHTVSFCISESDQEYLSRYNLSYKCAAFNFRDDNKAFNQRPQTKDKTEIQAYYQKLRDIYNNQLKSTKDTLLEMGKEADIIVGSGAQQIASTAADYLNLPYIHVFHSASMFPSGEFPPSKFPLRNLPSFINRFLWKQYDKFAARISMPPVNSIRAELGLPPFIEASEICRKHTLLSINKTLSPLPEDVTECLFHTDYWHLFEDAELDADLEDFLNKGEAPVYIGFGSMARGEHKQVESVVNYLLKNSDLRIIISKGWGNITGGAESDRLFEVGSLPHHKLFPRVKAVIHHGGAGTVSTALISGAPQVIVPHVFDQFYMADQIQKLGLGPKGVSLKKIETDLPKAILKAVSTPLYSEKAKEIQKAASQEKGIDEAIDFLLKKAASHTNAETTETSEPVPAV